MKKKMTAISKLIILTASSLLLASCMTISELGEQTSLSIDRNVSLNKIKVIVFPITSQTNSSFNNTLLDAQFITIWEKNIGKENVIPASYLSLKENANARAALDIIYQSIKENKPSKIKGTVAESFISDISSKYGHYPIAFAMISADKDFYDLNGNITTQMGLLNPNNYSWKWIAERKFKNNLLIVSFEDAVLQSIKSSVSDLKKDNDDKLY
ncbi:hypothetical protein [Fluviispira sanaruensis]|uniref:Lipoprotein n=1 Tax=Fluviispira sanaruensis TaxID=2493639 RepID=A0A4P2VKE1_FLUSA|nr:hypothetical protein [Fluviispira sanaruensis]BBH53763.1 hypothetical protein JCM31447_22110 [Fluviispira sanaruensis]